MYRVLVVAALMLAAGAPAIAGDLPAPQMPPPQMPPPQMLPPQMPPQAPTSYVPASPRMLDWTGVYFGANGGYALGSTDWGGATPAGRFDVPGFLFGGTFGANYQMDALLAGLEGDLDWTDLAGSKVLTTKTCKPTDRCETESDFLGTARVRGGYVWGRSLLYVTAGAAFGDIRAGRTTILDSTDRLGWTAGGGVEFAVVGNMTARIEYLYVDLSSISCTVSCPKTTTVSLTENVVRAGVDYKFGW